MCADDDASKLAQSSSSGSKLTENGISGASNHAPADETQRNERVDTPEPSLLSRHEEPHVHAGRKAEENFLTDLLSINGVNRCALFPGLRVPYWSHTDNDASVNGSTGSKRGQSARPPRQRHKRKKTSEFEDGYEILTLPKVTAAQLARGEVDMVIVSQRGIFVIEIKNWSGTLSTDGMMCDYWYQHRTNGTTLLHKNAVMSIEEKAKNLLGHLRREGCPVPCCYRTYVLLWDG